MIRFDPLYIVADDVAEMRRFLLGIIAELDKAVLEKEDDRHKFHIEGADRGSAEGGFIVLPTYREGDLEKFFGCLATSDTSSNPTA